MTRGATRACYTVHLARRDGSDTAICGKTAQELRSMETSTKQHRIVYHAEALIQSWYDKCPDCLDHEDLPLRLMAEIDELDDFNHALWQPSLPAKVPSTLP